MRHTNHDSHSKGILVLQIKPFIGADCVICVEPHWASTEDVRQVVFGTFYMLDCVVVDLKVGLDIQESGVLDLHYVLELEVL